MSQGYCRPLRLAQTAAAAAAAAAAALADRDDARNPLCDWAAQVTC